MRSRRGQFQHVFSFILMMLIAGVVLLMGYKFISQILGQSCSVEKLDLKNALESDFKRYASYGSYHEPTYLVPCDSEMICFIDADVFGEAADGLYPGNSGFTYRINAIQGEVRAPTPNNVFLVYDDHVEPLQLFSTRISVANDVFCINATSGRFRLGMEGKGRTVVLTYES
ncbi:hypothetical protein GOV07_04460 [Candidatus Woesearchaeota archaeon]|nr:hypothetical protein [Candidatus Woesearchaeota archaeon]